MTKITILLLTVLGCSSEKECTHYFDPMLQEKVYTTANELAQFGSSKVDFWKYLQTNLLLENNESVEYHSGFIELIISGKGKVLKVNIYNRFKNKIESESFNRTLLEMPNWNPAKCNGRFVTSKVWLDFNIGF